MTDHKESKGIFLTVDIVIISKDGYVVLINRKNPPFQDKLVFPGGHVDLADRSIIHAAQREAREEVSKRFKLADFRILPIVLDHPDRDPRKSGRRISIVTLVVAETKEGLKGLKASDDAKTLYIVPIKFLTRKKMGFDHYRVIEYLRENVI